jgi:hypothetical protein
MAKVGKFEKLVHSKLVKLVEPGNFQGIEPMDIVDLENLKDTTRKKGKYTSVDEILEKLEAIAEANSCFTLVKNSALLSFISKLLANIMIISLVMVGRLLLKIHP